jgi:hypothetical protein
MDENLTPTTPLKRDQLGRVSSTAEQRAEVLAAFERSGLKGKAFAALAGINYQTFMGWRWAKAQRSAPATPSKQPATTVAVPPTFIEAVVTGSGLPLEQARCLDEQAHGLEVTLPGGSMLRIASPHQVALAAQLLNALRAPC